jgi:hypothetical protein
MAGVLGSGCLALPETVATPEREGMTNFSGVDEVNMVE